MPVINSVEFSLKGRVLETTQTSGAGTYSLDGVSTTGRQSFLSAVGDGEKTAYVVSRGGTWEVAIGTVNAGTPVTLTRDLILGTSSDYSVGADAIDWPDTLAKDVLLVAPSELLNQIDPSIIAFLAQANTFSGNLKVSKNTSPATSAEVQVEEAAGGITGELTAHPSGYVRMGTTSDHDVRFTRNNAGVAELDSAGFNLFAGQGTIRQDDNPVVCAPNIFESAEQSISSGSVTEVAHSLGGVPKQAWGVLRCKTDDAGFTAGDEIETFSYRSVSADTEEGVLVGADATNVFFSVGSSGIRLWNKSTGQNSNLTLANWRVVLRAWI